MKKLFVVLLALAVIGTIVFAEDAKLSVGAWGRGWYTAVGSDGKDQIVAAGPGWGGNGARVGVQFTGTSDNVGFTWNPGVNGDATTFNAICDQAKMWVTLNPMFKVEIGKIQGDALRGKLGDFGDIVGNTGGEDDIFARFNTTTGMLLDITPVDGVYLGAALDVPAASIATSTIGKHLLSDAYKSVQVGAGYTIANIGLARAQFIGKVGVNNDTGKDEVGIFNAAFAYTGMAGLTVDAGFKYNLESKQQMSAAAGAKYSADALGVFVRAGASFGGDSDLYQLALNGGAQLSYTVADPLSVGIEASYKGKQALKTSPDPANYLDVFPFVKLGYSNGYLKVGFDARVGLDGQDLMYQLPIQIEYWF
jgi:hypothetical protein